MTTHNTTQRTAMCCEHFHTRCCHMGTAIKHPVPDWVKPPFVIFDIRALWHSDAYGNSGCQRNLWSTISVEHTQTVTQTDKSHNGSRLQL